jgi:hypothetical protein
MHQQTVLWIIYSSSFLTVGVLIFGLKIAPIFTISLIASAGAILLFLFSEKWYIHAAAEFENRFWTVVAFLSACAIFFAQDSPLVLATGGRIPIEISWICIAAIAFSVHIYDRNQHRESLIKSANIRRAVHTESSSANVAEIGRLLKGIDNPWISSTFANVFLLPRVLYLEAQILKVFQKASKEELNQVILY